MKAYERKRKKSGRKEPLSYIYKERNEYIPPTSRRSLIGLSLLSVWSLLLNFYLL